MKLCDEDKNNGQMDVKDGSVENYDFAWGANISLPAEETEEENPVSKLDEVAGITDNMIGEGSLSQE